MIWRLCAACLCTIQTFLWPVLTMVQEPVWAYRVAQTSGNRFSNSPGLCRGVFLFCFVFLQKLYGFLCEEICASEYYLLAQNCKEKKCLFVCAQSTIGVDYVNPCPYKLHQQKGELRSLCCLTSFSISIIHPLVLCPEPNIFSYLIWITKWPVLFGYQEISHLLWRNNS